MQKWSDSLGTGLILPVNGQGKIFCVLQTKTEKDIDLAFTSSLPFLLELRAPFTFQNLVKNDRVEKLFFLIVQSKHHPLDQGRHEKWFVWN